MQEKDRLSDTPDHSSSEIEVDAEDEMEVQDNSVSVTESPDSPPGGGDGNDNRPPSDGEPPSRDDRIDQITIEDEVQSSFLGYAMSVIVSRALPDARDGLKPVHRRCLFAMDQLNNRHDRPPMKSARVSGEIMGKYHPHSDDAIYETIVRMAQDFLMRYPLIDGQGNFGSVDGDPPAAPRYTESRMTRLAGEMLQDIDMDTVDFVPNYDETLEMPLVLPSRIPNLLINGSYGIAVAMATNVLPHNLSEAIDACIALEQNRDLSVNDLIEFVKGPDFPTGGIINGRRGILDAHRTGKGRIVVRSKTEIVTDKTGRESIIVNEIPYQVNKTTLITKIAELVRNKTIDSVSELRDESDKDGMRIVIELKRGELAQIVLNQLFAKTPLESALSYNSVALLNGQPKRLNLKEMLTAFLNHRHDVVMRRTTFLLQRARRQGHILEGRSIALVNIDAVVDAIKRSATRQEALGALLQGEDDASGWAPRDIESMLEAAERDLVRPEDLESIYGFRHVEDGSVRYFLSPEQANSILDLQLHRLTGLARTDIAREYQDIVNDIRDYINIINTPARVSQIVQDELTEIRERYGDERRTQIVDVEEELTEADIIEPKEVVITISDAGYAKRQGLEDYRAQRRGGVGTGSTRVKEGDVIEEVIVTNSHDKLLCFTDLGRVYSLDVFRIPETKRGTRGRPIVNLIDFREDENPTCYLAMKKEHDRPFLLFATQQGVVKRCRFEDFQRISRAGLKAIRLDEGDRLIDVAATDGTQNIVLAHNGGMAIRFKESDVRVMGRTARGVRGLRLRPNTRVVSANVGPDDAMLLTVSANGFGKRTTFSAIRLIRRGGLGVRLIQTSKRNGELVDLVRVEEGDHALIVTDAGMLIRINVADVGIYSRQAAGSRLMRLREGQSVSSITRMSEDAVQQTMLKEEAVREERQESRSQNEATDDPDENSS